MEQGGARRESEVSNDFVFTFTCAEIEQQLEEATTPPLRRVLPSDERQARAQARVMEMVLPGAAG